MLNTNVIFVGSFQYGKENDEKEDVKEECIEKMFSTTMPSGRGRKQKDIICPQCKNKIVTWSTR